MKKMTPISQNFNEISRLKKFEITRFFKPRPTKIDGAQILGLDAL